MPPAEKFGQYLLRNQVITQEQLNEALQCQVIFGGRLGTNLVELGYLTLDDLARLLSRRSGYPAASPEELEELPREILSSLPRTTIEKYKIIPMRVEAKTLHLAVCDPTDVKSMDEIQFATGMRIKPYLLPELRMFYLLERHYGIKRDIRYIRLGRSLSRGKYAGAMVGTPASLSGDVAVPGEANGASAAAGTGAQAAPGAANNTADLELKGFRKLREGEELTDEATHQAQIQQMLATGTLAEQANSPTAKMRAGIAADAPAAGITPPVAMQSAAPAPVVMGTPVAPAPVAPVAPVAPAAPVARPATAPPVAPTPLPATPAPASLVAAPRVATTISDEVGPTMQIGSPFAGSKEDEPTLPLPVGVLPLLDETHLEPIEPIEDEVAPAPAAAATIPFPPPASKEEAAKLKATLTAAADRDEAAAACLRLARAHASAVALVIVNKGMLAGWKGAGGALDRQGIESIMLPASADSILKAPAAGGLFHGPVPPGGLNDRLLAALGRKQPIHAMVIPIQLGTGTRVVNLLYADNGHEPITPEAQAVLQIIARDMSAAYERIIMAKKKSAT